MVTLVAIGKETVINTGNVFSTIEACEGFLKSHEGLIETFRTLKFVCIDSDIFKSFQSLIGLL